MMTRSSWFLLGAMSVVGMTAAVALRLAAPEPVPPKEVDDTELKVIVRNQGGESLPAGIPVTVSVRKDGVETPLTLLRTPVPLAPGAATPPMGAGVSRSAVDGEVVVRTLDDGVGATSPDAETTVLPAR